MNYLTKAGVNFLNEKMVRKKGKDTSTARLSTDPNDYGTYITGKPKSRPKNISVAHSKHFEPAEKMKTKKAKASVAKIKASLKAGNPLRDPVVRDPNPRTRQGKVKKIRRGKARREYTVFDGGHRLHSFKELGRKTIPSVTPGKVIR